MPSQFEHHGHMARVACCSLNQWAMDFDTNYNNIVKSIAIAKARGCRFRTGPELEITGYSCYDHFLESDIYLHSWESVSLLIAEGHTDDMLVDIGMPVVHRSVRYNCRVFICNREIILIRPKVALANDGNYRELRWFAPWDFTAVTDDNSFRPLENFLLPQTVAQVCKNQQKQTVFGVAIVQLLDASVASETCEELWTPNSPHIALGLNGVDMFVNGSGSHHELRKLTYRLDLIKGATAKNGGVYLYSNSQGCDGDRLYFDGAACVAVNGRLVKLGSQFSLSDVEVVDCVVDIESVRSYRGAISSRSMQSTKCPHVPTVHVDFSLCCASPSSSSSTAEETKFSQRMTPATPILFTPLHPSQEIASGPACWLWDYLRRSRASGFFLPLSGGADSAATAAIVGNMCQLVSIRVQKGDSMVLQDLKRMIHATDEDMKRFQETYSHAVNVAKALFHTCYMGTVNSSKETRERAAALAAEIGAYHLDTDIDDIVKAMKDSFATTLGKTPEFRAHGGSYVENLALQNIQARQRMVYSYLQASLLPWVRNRQGFLLVLSSGNVDEALRGYMTKYDCSSGDLNPIGGISKVDLREFLLWAAQPQTLNYPSLAKIAHATPTAELEPVEESYVQTDEDDMGMSYADLKVLGTLRKVQRCGPVSMYQKLLGIWPHHTPKEVAKKVKFFFKMYAINRHKASILTPSYHAENYSPDDNRFDPRQILYNAAWPRQFRLIDALVSAAEGNEDDELKSQL